MGEMIGLYIKTSLLYIFRLLFVPTHKRIANEKLKQKKKTESLQSHHFCVGCH